MNAIVPLGVRLPESDNIDEAGGEMPLLLMRGVDKSFGTTHAVQNVCLSVSGSTIIGLMGGNGAGKSTLMKIVGGLLAPDGGQVIVAGRAIAADHSPANAKRLGIRFVHQELSLCPNLRVYENFAVELPDIVRGVRWRRTGIAFARAALHDVFPGNTIDPRVKVSALSLSQRQMVEIARATADPQAKLLILDEPTSSLGSREAEQVRIYMKRRAAAGLSFIFISHRLHEMLELADHIVVMRNGTVPWQGPAGGIGSVELVRLLGGTEFVREAASAAARPNQPDLALEVANVEDRGLHSVSLTAAKGEIVGLAGLEGSGQRRLLRSIFSRRRPAAGSIVVRGRLAFVSGDRATEGIFDLWPIDENIAISGLARVSRWGVVSLARLRDLTSGWFDRLRVRASNGSAPIVSLSGGNQQKVVIARALAAEADIVLLDDPTRGVDLQTKSDLYRLFRKLANEGRTVIWYSTDDAEFAECDRTIVLRNGRVVAELARDEATVDRVVEASFRTVDEDKLESEAQRRLARSRKWDAWVPTAIPIVTFVVVFGLCALQNASILSSFGMTLVFSAAFGLAFASISQLFIITAGDIDLGIGPFIGLINALAATWLVTDPWLAALCFAALLAAYSVMGLFIHLRAVPAIVVTLGMSFIWLGLASLRLPRAGGSAPEWLVEFLSIKPPILPMPVYLSVVPAAAAYLILMVWRYGAVLRGFGASPRAIEAAGWSTGIAKACLYGLAGLFGVLAGLVITGSTRGGDPTGAVSMTLLSVAAVILGGAAFTGGVVAPIGALFGVMTLVLVGTLLSLLEVSGQYLPMVQGLLLLGVVGLRSLLVRRPA